MNTRTSTVHHRTIPRLAEGATRVPCWHCDGKGTRALTQSEANTLASLEIDWQTTAVVRYNMGGRIKGSALVNRLNELVDLGLVERLREGRQVEWRLA